MFRFALQLDVTTTGNLCLHGTTLLEIHLYVTTSGDGEQRIARGNASHLDITATSNVAGNIVTDNVRQINVT
jgi:hypothetical protein